MADTVFLLPHLPKCAGTTVEAHLHRHLGPTGFWSPGRRLHRLPIEMLGRKYDGRAPDPLGAIRAVSGHYLGRSVADLFPSRPIWRGVLLRQPAELILSWYNYRMMRYLEAGRRPYSFALHLAGLPPDPIAHFLLERWCELPWWRMAAMTPAQKRDRLDAELARFDFVGDIADCDRLIADISHRLGIPARAAPGNTEGSWRARVAWTPVRADQLSREDEAALEVRTRLDRYLWQRWAGGQPVPSETVRPTGFLRAELGRPLAELRRRAQRGRASVKGR